MSIRFAFAVPAASLLVFTVPAMAQQTYHDDRYIQLAQADDVNGAWEDLGPQDAEAFPGNWSGTYTDLDGTEVSGDYHGTFIGDDSFLADDGTFLAREGESAWMRYAEDADGVYRRVRISRAIPPRHAVGPRFAYSNADRAEWLDQCRLLRNDDRGYYYEEAEDGHRGNSGLIAGILGAAIGGFAGNRIADNHRLRGTLIGAGIGGVAGAVLGTLADELAHDDRDPELVVYHDEPGFDYCEAYLLNYERGYGMPQQIAYAPVALMAAPVQQPMGHHERRYRVIEERIEVPVEAPAPQISREIPPRPQPRPQTQSKLQSIK